MALVDHTLKSKVSISIKCKDIPSYDLLSPSDPMAVLYSLPVANTGGGGDGRMIGHTEAIKDDANAVFQTQIPVDYEFESVQNFRLVLYDIDDPSDLTNFSKQERIGYFDFTLASLMCSPNAELTTDIFKGNSTTEKHKNCKITIRGTEVVDSRIWLRAQIRALDLAKQSWFSRDNTCLEFVAMNNGTETVLHRTPVITKSQSPLYPVAEFGLTSAFSSVDDLSPPITLRVVRIKDDAWKSRTVVGEYTAPVESMLRPTASSPQKKFTLTKPGTKTASGTIVVELMAATYRPTFLDYVSSGNFAFQLVVGIDFTGSNVGTVNLHEISNNPNVLNQYESAIMSVGNILSNYAKANKITALGYGARVSVDNGPKEVNFCFPLTLSSERAQVNDINELLYAYRYALKNMTLSGPTLFKEIIEYATAVASRPFTSTSQHYTILLILTDGMINDMSQTVDAIVKASDKPLSIVIVGIGNANFDSMDTLDGDEQRLTSPTFGPAIRDIVQFVPLNQLKGQPMSALAQETLHEIPEQVLSFFTHHGIMPLSPSHQQQNASAAPAPYIPPQ